MFFCVKFLLVLFVFSIKVDAKPFDDAILFRDDDEPQSYLNLKDENQILPSDEASRLLPDNNEIVQQELENGEFFQGDIVLLPEQKQIFRSNVSDGSVPTRTGWLDDYYRWPKNINGYVILPYTLSTKSKFSNYQKTLLRYAMNDIEKYTCVRFLPRSTEQDFVHVYAGSGCHSNMGKIGGQQDISLQKNGCFSRGTIIHEFIHALGYDHMHSHSNRDKFVEIKWNNIQQSAVSNFDKVDSSLFGNFGTNYDLYSLMHYDKDAFSKNGQDTIVPRNPRYKKIIGQRIGLSVGDVKRINNMYECYQ